MNTQPTRRKFLRTGCMTAAAVGVVACGGLGLAATYQPPIDFPETTYGDTTVNTNRVLIAYASKAGSTAEVAVKMGETLSKQGLAVDVMQVNKVKDLSAYQTVILGSAIRVGKPLPEAISFVEKNQAALQQKQFNAFVVCMTIKDDTEANRQTANAFLDPVRALVKPASEGIFAGAVIPDKLGLLERFMMNVMKSPIGDFRQWDQINGWVEAMPAA